MNGNGSVERATNAALEAPSACERLTAVAKTGRTCEVVLVLRGQVFPPLDDGRGRWRLRTAHGQTTFEASDLLALTVMSRPRRD
jgi:hypothetical protein